MSNYDLSVNYEAVGELLKGAESQKMIGDIASGIQSRAGTEYESSVTVGRLRAKATVRPATPHAYYSNLKHNTLLKALGG